jgi:uncharacterized lipoprotein YmbA
VRDLKRTTQYPQRPALPSRAKSVTALGCVVLAGWIAAGCLGSSPPVKYYTFGSIAESEARDDPSELAVSVGPVHLPSYLDRQQIVTRPGGSRVLYDEYHRWAGVLQSEIPRTLADNLRILLASDRIVAYPTPAPFAIDYRVIVEIERFDADQGGDAVLRARWSIQPSDRGNPLAVERTDLQRSLASSSYSKLAAAHSELLAELSRAIAVKIRELESGPGETEPATTPAATPATESEPAEESSD